MIKYILYDIQYKWYIKNDTLNLGKCFIIFFYDLHKTINFTNEKDSITNGNINTTNYEFR